MVVAYHTNMEYSSDYATLSLFVGKQSYEIASFQMPSFNEWLLMLSCWSTSESVFSVR